MIEKFNAEYQKVEKNQSDSFSEDNFVAGKQKNDTTGWKSDPYVDIFENDEIQRNNQRLGVPVDTELIDLTYKSKDLTPGHKKDFFLSEIRKSRDRAPAPDIQSF